MKTLLISFLILVEVCLIGYWLKLEIQSNTEKIELILEEMGMEADKPAFCAPNYGQIEGRLESDSDEIEIDKHFIIYSEDRSSDSLKEYQDYLFNILENSYRDNGETEYLKKPLYTLVFSEGTKYAGESVRITSPDDIKCEECIDEDNCFYKLAGCDETD